MKQYGPYDPPMSAPATLKRSKIENGLSSVSLLGFVFGVAVTLTITNIAEQGLQFLSIWSPIGAIALGIIALAMSYVYRIPRWYLFRGHTIRWGPSCVGGCVLVLTATLIHYAFNGRVRLYHDSGTLDMVGVMLTSFQMLIAFVVAVETEVALCSEHNAKETASDSHANSEI